MLSETLPPAYLTPRSPLGNPKGSRAWSFLVHVQVDPRNYTYRYMQICNRAGTDHNLTKSVYASARSLIYSPAENMFTLWTHFGQHTCTLMHSRVHCALGVIGWLRVIPIVNICLHQGGKGLYLGQLTHALVNNFRHSTSGVNVLI